MNPKLANFCVTLLEKGETEYPPALYSFLFETIYQAVLTEKIASGQAEKHFHLSPEKICVLFSRGVRKSFGRFAEIVLNDWNIRSSRDVGKAVFAMAEHGCLTLSGTEKLEDFERVQESAYRQEKTS